MARPDPQSVPIDEALENTKYGKFNYFLICVSGFILINTVMETLGICFVLPITKCDMDLTYQQKGILGAVGFIGIITSSHLWGFLADTTGRRRVIRPTLIAGYIVTVISSFSPNFTTLIFLRFVNGFLISAGSATIYAYLGEFHCNRTRNRAIMSAAFISAAVAAAYPIMAWAIINQTWYFYVPFVDIFYRPWRMYILCCGLLGFVSGLCFFRLPESPKYLLSIGREEDAIDVLKRIYSINTGNRKDSYRISSIMPDVTEGQRVNEVGENTSGVMILLRSMWNQTAPLFMREYCAKTVLTCIIQFWIFFSAQGLYMWFPSLLNSVMQFTSKHPTEKDQICQIYYMTERAKTGEEDCDQTLEITTFLHTLSLEIIYVVLFLFVGYFTGRVGRIPTFFTILLLCGICGVLCALVNIPLLAVYSLAVLLACGLGTTVLNSITVDIYPTHLRAMAVCISLMIGRIGSVVGTNVIGALLEYHCQMAVVLSSVSLILGGLLVFLIPKGINMKKDNPSEDA